MRKPKILFFIMLLMSLVLISCETENNGNNDNSDEKLEGVTLNITTDKTTYYQGDNIIVDINISEEVLVNKVELEVLENESSVTILKNVIVPNEVGELKIVAKIEDLVSNQITINILEDIYMTDPYKEAMNTSFYENYEESINPKDSYYRSLHGFMSGDIELPNERPIIADYQPKEEEYIRNTSAYYLNNNETYFIVDGYGEIVDMIFKNGGYISLDEVAAHLLAFGSTPGNYISKKSGRPSESIWKEYLRLNNSAFSGDVVKYPYEPVLPRISGCGGDLKYYEIDFGTTGTTCDPSYDVVVYNTGTKITRGAARLVYTRYDANGNDIIDLNERYVFYTYNHYNDFQEYLNYQNGWGEMFGNITGGGELSSKYNYNPTEYVRVIKKDITTLIDLENFETSKEEIVVNVIIKKKEEFLEA